MDQKSLEKLLLTRSTVVLVESSPLCGRFVFLDETFMRRSFVWHVLQGSVLDSEEGIRFRGKTVSVQLPKFKSDWV